MLLVLGIMMITITIPLAGGFLDAAGFRDHNHIEFPFDGHGKLPKEMRFS